MSLMMLIFLKIIGELFGRMFLSLGSSDVFLLIEVSFCIFEKNITEIMLLPSQGSLSKD